MVKHYRGKIPGKNGWYIKYNDTIENLGFYLEMLSIKNKNYVLENGPNVRIKDKNIEICEIISEGIYSSIFVFDKKFLKILKQYLRKSFKIDHLNIYDLNLNVDVETVFEHIKNFLKNKNIERKNYGNIFIINSGNMVIELQKNGSLFVRIYEILPFSQRMLNFAIIIFFILISIIMSIFNNDFLINELLSTLFILLPILESTRYGKGHSLALSLLRLQISGSFKIQ